MTVPPYGTPEYWDHVMNKPSGVIFDTPQDLLDCARDYFAWAHSTPLQAQKLFFYKGAVVSANEAKMRVFTIEGLCSFIGMSSRNFLLYAEDPEHRMYDAAMMIKQIIYTQKFEGASANLLNPVIIARDLGLADKKEVTGGKGGPVVITDAMTLKEAAEAYASTIATE